MMYQSASTSTSRRTRKTERRARLKFNHSLKPKTDRKVRQTARDARLVDAQAAATKAAEYLASRLAELQKASDEEKAPLGEMAHKANNADLAAKLALTRIKAQVEARNAREAKMLVTKRTFLN